jgi:hypothetical protein
LTLPTTKDEEIYSERPGDTIYAKIKHYIPNIIEKSSALKEEFIQIIIEDLVLDHALSNALDDVGTIIEYQAQTEGIEKPKFNGLSILKDAERVGKLNFILNLCFVVGLDEETTESIRAAEIERLWGGEAKAKKDMGGGPVLKLPDDVAGILKDITRSLNKKGSTKEDVPTDRHQKAANSLARTLRERANSNSTASKRGKKSTPTS